MCPSAIYFTIGLVFGVIWILGTVVAIVRYAFHCMNTKYPNPSTINKVPGIALAGEKYDSWLQVFFVNLLICFPICIGCLIVWPIGILLLIQAVISTARKKRFGDD